MLTENEERKIKDAALELISYVDIAQNYIENNLSITEMVNLRLIIDKMEENTDTFKEIYELL